MFLRDLDRVFLTTLPITFRHYEDIAILHALTGNPESYEQRSLSPHSFIL